MLTMQLFTTFVATIALLGITLANPLNPAAPLAAILRRGDDQLTTKKTTTTSSVTKPSSTKKTTTTTSRKITTTVTSVKKSTSTEKTTGTSKHTTSHASSPTAHSPTTTSTSTTKTTNSRTTTPGKLSTTTSSVPTATTPLCNLENGVNPGLLSPTQGQYFYYDPTPGSSNNIINITVIYCSAQSGKTKSISGDVWLGLNQRGRILGLQQLPDNKDVPPHSPYYSYHFNVTYNPNGINGNLVGAQQFNFYEAITGTFYPYGYINNFVTLNFQQWPENNPMG